VADAARDKDLRRLLNDVEKKYAQLFEKIADGELQRTVILRRRQFRDDLKDQNPHRSELFHAMGTLRRVLESLPSKNKPKEEVVHESL